MNVEDFRLLYDYNAWADHRTLDACAALSPEQFTQDLASSFHSVRDTLLHIMQVEWIWLERWHGRSPTSFAADREYSDVESIRGRWLEIERDLLDYVASLTPKKCSASSSTRPRPACRKRRRSGRCCSTSVNHGTYHRGQVATMLRQLGAKPSATDLIFFYRERAAQAKA